MMYSEFVYLEFGRTIKLFPIKRFPKFKKEPFPGPYKKIIVYREPR